MEKLKNVGRIFIYLFIVEIFLIVFELICYLV